MCWELLTRPETAGDQVSTAVIFDMQNKQVLVDSCILLNQSINIITTQVYYILYNKQLYYTSLFDS